MGHRATGLLLATLLAGGAQAQTFTITAAEGFFDNAMLPEGTGTPLSPLDASNVFVGGLDISGLAPGPHVFYVRYQDDTGDWTDPPIALPFLVPDNTGVPTLDTFESYFDTDPGQGSGDTIAVTPVNGSVIVETGLDVSGLAAGNRLLGFRFADSAGDFSETIQAPFILRADSATPLAIVESEFYLETDPGLGLGSIMTLSPIAGSARGVIADGRADLMAQAMNMTGGLIGTRLLDSTGQYSPNLFQTVSVEDMDGDMVPDVIDAFPMDITEWRDTDGDGIGNNTDPDIDGDGMDNTIDDDDDGDGMLDSFENAFGFDPRDPVDSFRDADLDGLTNLEEAILGTDPTNPDTDGDGVPDPLDPTPGKSGVLNEVPLPGDIDTGDAFGSAVAVEGDLFVAGAPDDEGGGAVYAYRIVGGEPVFEARIPVPPGFVAEDFGASLDIDGDNLVIGAPGDPVIPKGSAVTAMRAAVYERVNQQWSFKQPVTTTAGSGDAFGASVALSGGMMVIGAPNDNGSGVAHVYSFQGGSSEFELSQEVVPSSPQPGEGFGSSVTASDGKFAVGSPNAQVGQAVLGSVSLYDMVSGNLADLGMVTGSATTEGFGASISLVGDVMAVGAPGENGDQGAVYTFGVSNTVTQLNHFTPTDAVAGDRFGAAVGFDGTTVAAGAPGSLGVGAFYTLDGSSLDQLERFERTPDATQFGASVAISGDRIVVGAPTTRTTGAVALQRDVRVIFESGFER